MNLLLDTHTLIWLLEGDERMSSNAKSTIQNPENDNHISMVSFWEMAIKISIGKLKMKAPFDGLHIWVSENGIEVIPINFEHTRIVKQLTFHHKDPFDRIIIAQALSLIHI